MWFDYETLRRSADRFFRHFCDQNDQLKYSWIYHDGENFGIEQIRDKNVKFRIEWLKENIGKHGGDWTSRILLRSTTKNRTTAISTFFYFHYETPWIDEIRSDDDSILIRGRTEELEKFQIRIQIYNRSSNNVVLRTLTDRFQLEKIDQEILRKLNSNSAQQPLILLRNQPVNETFHNTFFLQITTSKLSFDEDFRFEIIFQSDSASNERRKDLTEKFFTDEIQRLKIDFDRRFEEIFQLKTKFNFTEKKIDFARSTLSNLIGGISYFTGQSLVAQPNQTTPDLYWKTNLYTAVPSRSFFPRGFLWDEGFHNLLIARWNRNITKEILSHWFDLLNDRGWIPREVILGPEARARVPSEFVVQYTNNANPPTFFLTIDYLLKTNPDDSFFSLNFFRRLERWYQWYNRTQTGKLPFSFRWRGRNATSIFELNPKTLTSGLDDFPRASHPTDDERHVDLRCWMSLATSVMAKLYSKLHPYSTNRYLSYSQLLSDNNRLDQLHWSDDDQMYADFGLHTDFLQLQHEPFKSNSQSRRFTRQLTNPSDLHERFVHHFGYISLFPFLTRIIDSRSDKLSRILDDLTNSTLLWTPYGLRSLAQSSSIYKARNTEHDPPYWRGSIWININYMALSALNYYANDGGPYSNKARDVYIRLRSNLIENMFRVYSKTGHIWEQYDDITGEGKGCHPFTGWSSLIVLIMSELYDK